MPDLIPGGHPVRPTADGLVGRGDLDAMPPFEFAEAVHRVHLDGNGRRPGGDIRLEAAQILQRLLRAFLDHLPGADGRNLPGGVARQPMLDGHAGETIAQVLAAFADDGGIAGHQGDGCTVMAAQRRIDAALAHQIVIEPQVMPLHGGDGVAQHAIGGVIAGMHPDQQAGVAALFEQLGIARPRVMRHPLAVGVEQIRDETVKKALDNRQN